MVWNQSCRVLKVVENTCQSTPSLCKECSGIKNKITIELSQNEKYCTSCKSVKDWSDLFL